MKPNSQKLHVKERYDSTVEDYDRVRFGTSGGKFLDRLEKRYVLKHLKGDSVLHVGTATGRFTKLLSELGYNYVGIEISTGMAKASKTLCKKPNCHLVQGDGECLPFQEGSFDNVLCVRSFHFLPSPRTFLAEARRVATVSGRIVVSFETFTVVRRIVEKLKILPRPLPRRAYYRISDVIEMFEQNHLKVCWAGKVTKLPIVSYFRSSGFSARMIQRLHPSLPTWLGTVGLVVGTIQE